MARKSKFLLVDLNDSKVKKLASTITSTTSRKILNLLVTKEETEANIAKSLKIPISTVHYHLKKLCEAKLVIVDEFHYSPKGREVNHYKLANKYIIIAPKNVDDGILKKLKSILPVSIISFGASLIYGLSMFKKTISSTSIITDNSQNAMILPDPAADAMISPSTSELVTATSEPAILSAILFSLAVMGVSVVVFLLLRKLWRRR